jgi:hypothetical protein
MTIDRNLTQLSTVGRVVARLRTPRPADVVQVSFTGTPAAVTAVARTLAQVVVVTSMTHTPTADAHIRVDATCHHPHRIGR